MKYDIDIIKTKLIIAGFNPELSCDWAIIVRQGTKFGYYDLISNTLVNPEYSKIYIDKYFAICYGEPKTLFSSSKPIKKIHIPGKTQKSILSIKEDYLAAEHNYNDEPDSLVNLYYGVESGVYILVNYD